MAEWIKQESGRLVLAGTVMSVRYKPSAGGDYAVYQGERFCFPCGTLLSAKTEAARIAAEFEEIVG